MNRLQPFQTIATIITCVALCTIAISQQDPRSSASTTETTEPWGRILWKESSLELAVSTLPKNRKISIPRLNNRMKSVHVQGESPDESKLQFRPEIKTWEITIPADVKLDNRLIIFETIEPIMSATPPHVIVQADDGSVTLAAQYAITHGELLRYEPQPHKNTVGYWAHAKDWFQWHVSINKPVTFDVEVLQGCGEGHGGSTVSIELAGEKCQFQVEDTGHFQNFKPRRIGVLRVRRAGEFTLDVRALEKVKGAVCDIRQIRLLPVDKTTEK